VQPASTGFNALQRFVRKHTPEERCELCGAAIAEEHDHLVEPAARRLVCSCRPCAILFSAQAVQRYKRVPMDIRVLTRFHLSDTQWDSLLVPINLAYFFRCSVSNTVVAMYPSPAGATESLLPLETWNHIVAENPVLERMEPDVEALLVNRLGEKYGFPAHQYFIAPIDQCFKLVGLVRANWRGLSGGAEVWQRIQQFLGGLAGHGSDCIEEPHRA
jgi:hypothetical protein